MTSRYKKMSAAATWVLAIVAVSVLLGIGSPAAWFIVAIVAVGPAAILLYLSRDLMPTTSERIHAARR